MGKKLRIQSAAVCSRGCIRRKNEDNLCFDLEILPQMHQEIPFGIWNMENQTQNPILFSVFDGMGGYERGEQSSYIAALEAKESPVHVCRDGEKIPMELAGICYRANEKVCKLMERTGSRTGTTASMLCFFREHVYLCNIGDSPIFRMRNGILETVFQEHTERVIYEKIFKMDRNNRKKYPLTQNIGIFEEEMLIEPYIVKYEVKRGDIYLICSDGLSDMVSEIEIADVLKEELLPETAARSLEKAALDAGGRDNITIICIRVL